MATAHTLPRPDLMAHRESTILPFSEIVLRVANAIGRKLTAYLGNVKDVRAVDRWMNGGAPYGDSEERLRFAFIIIQTLMGHESSRVVQAWLTGVNPELGDRIPLRLLREGDLSVVGPEVLGAARAFIAGG